MILVLSPLVHKFSKAFVKETEFKYGIFLLHSEIRCLSRIKVLNIFLEFIDEIQNFLYKIGKHDIGLYNNKSFFKTFVLNRHINHYNDFNLYDSKKITTQFKKCTRNKRVFLRN